MKKFVFVLFVAMICVGLSGCAAKQRSREEMLALHSALESARIKTYSGIPKEKIISACEKALLSFEDDYTFTHNPDGFVAKRKWTIYYILGFQQDENFWKITASTNEDGVVVTTLTWKGEGTVAQPFPVRIPGGSESQPTETTGAVS